MSIQTSVKYLSRGNEAAWWIPFPYADPAQVAVAVIDPGGIERRLALGVDYVLNDSTVICIVPAGNSIVIWLDASLDVAMSGAVAGAARSLRASVEPAGPVYQAPAAATAVEQEAGGTGASEAAGREIEQICETTVDAAAAEIEQARREALAAVDQAASGAVDKIAMQAGLYGSATAQSGWLRLEESLPAGAILALPEGIGYFPGRNALLVYKNGAMQCPDVEWAEIPATDVSGAIVLLQAASMGSLFVFVVLPTTSAHVSEVNAKAARSAQNSASNFAGAADAAMSAALSASASAAACADNCRECYGNAEGLVDSCYQACHSAWHAAATASLHHRRPGISAVHNIDELGCAAPGLYIINPHLTHEPTPFMGIWPATCEADMAWDGIFFLGEKYPDEITLPPRCKCPPRPECSCTLPAGEGDSDDWLPCHHKHEPACPCSGNGGC